MHLYVTAQYFSRVNMEMQKTCDLLRHKIDESTGELRRKTDTTREDIEGIKRDVGMKASLAHVQEMKRQVATCATIAQVESFAGDVKGCQDSIKSFQSHLSDSLEAQDRVLERYDELFLDKASKTDVKQLDQKLQSVSKHINFERRVDDMEMKIDSCLETSKKQTEESEMLREQVEEFAKLVKNIKSEKRDIATLKNTLRDVLESLSSKADRSQFSELSDCKASSEEVNRISKALGMMHRVDKLTITLLQHTIKYLNGGTGMKAMEFGSAEWLLKHADLVAAWIAVYEPIENEVGFPNDFMTLLRPQKLLNERMPTAPTMKTQTAVGISLLTPNRKSRPITPTYSSTSRIATSLSNRHTPKRVMLQQPPPGLDLSLFHS